MMKSSYSLDNCKKGEKKEIKTKSMCLLQYSKSKSYRCLITVFIFSLAVLFATPLLTVRKMASCLTRAQQLEMQLLCARDLPEVPVPAAHSKRSCSLGSCYPSPYRFLMRRWGCSSLLYFVLLHCFYLCYDLYTLLITFFPPVWLIVF